MDIFDKAIIRIGRIISDNQKAFKMERDKRNDNNPKKIQTNSLYGELRGNKNGK